MLLETKNRISSLMFVFTGAETQSGLVGFSKIEKLSILKKKKFKSLHWYWYNLIEIFDNLVYYWTFLKCHDDNEVDGKDNLESNFRMNKNLYE